MPTLDPRVDAYIRTAPAFQAHCVFGFWKHALIVAELTKPQVKTLEVLGRIDADDTLPADKAILAIVKTAARFNDTGVKVPRVPEAPRPALKEPAWLLKALRADAAAWKAYAAFSPSHKREYVGWITEARTDATRERRLAQAIEWSGAGKSRNWKYERT